MDKNFRGVRLHLDFRLKAKSVIFSIESRALVSPAVSKFGGRSIEGK